MIEMIYNLHKICNIVILYDWNRFVNHMESLIIE